MNTVFGLIGSGWRAEFFLRIAQIMPEIFKVSGVVTTNPEKKKRFESQFGVAVFPDYKSMLSTFTPDFVVLCVKVSAAADIAVSLTKLGVPVLMETPPAGTKDELTTLYKTLYHDSPGAKIQVAEQYFLHPMHTSRLRFLDSGKIGTPTEAYISFSHSYHAMSLMRKYLRVGFENAKISAYTFQTPVVAGFTREGPPTEEKIAVKSHTVATLDFGDKLGIYDFEADQHRSYVRTANIKIKGERGEINNNDIKYLLDFSTPVETSFLRKNMGENENLEGLGLKGILADGQWFYKNPFPNKPLIDDEIAVACCLCAMRDYLNTGKSFYSLAEAMQDTYLALLIDEASNLHTLVESETQVWSI